MIRSPDFPTSSESLYRLRFHCTIIIFFWDVKRCTLEAIYRHFEVPNRLNLRSFILVNTRYSFSASCSSTHYPLQTDSISVSRRAVCFCIPTLTFWSLPVTICTASLTFNNCTLCPHCIYVFCICLRKNSDLCHLLHKLIGFYNRDVKCLQRGTDWGFNWSVLSWLCKGIYFSHFLV